MIIVSETAAALKSFLAHSELGHVARLMVMRLVLGFISHRGRMSCAQAAGMVAADPVHRGELTRFLARPRWQQRDFNQPFREALLKKEARRGGTFVFIVDATLVSQSGKKTQNTHSTGNRKRRPCKGRRYTLKKLTPKRCHTFTFGVLITPSGMRLPWQVPHLTKEYCAEHDLEHRTTAEAAAHMILSLPLPPAAKVVVLGDTAYDARVVQEACEARGYTWIVPANPERVYAGPRGQRPKLRTQLRNWSKLKLRKIRFHAAADEYAAHRRLSKWRVGPKAKPREYYVHQETATVRSVGRVQLVFSTTTPPAQPVAPENVKILMTNNLQLSAREIVSLYALRWQIELFFKELKSTLGAGQYSFHSFQAVLGWMQVVLTTVLFLETLRAQRMRDRDQPAEDRRWWTSQRLHGLCAAYRQECAAGELKYLAERLQTRGGIAKLKRLLSQATPGEYRVTT